MESRDVSRDVSRDPFLGFPVSVLKVSGLGLGLKGFWSQFRALRLETLHRLFFMKFCKKEFLNTLRAGVRYIRTSINALELS